MQAASPAKKAVPKYMLRTMVGSTMLPGMPKNWPRLFFFNTMVRKKTMKGKISQLKLMFHYFFAWRNLCHLLCQWFWICRIHVKQKPTFCDFCAQNTSNSTFWKKGVKLLQHPRCIGMVTCRGKYWHLVQSTRQPDLLWSSGRKQMHPEISGVGGIMLVKTEWTSKQEDSIGYPVVN